MHLDLPPELLPDDYLLLTIDLRDLPAEEIVALPPDPAAFGDAWLRDQRSPVLQVPSLIVPKSPNFCSTLPIQMRRVPASSHGAGSSSIGDCGCRCDVSRLGAQANVGIEGPSRRQHAPETASNSYMSGRFEAPCHA